MELKRHDHTDWLIHFVRNRNPTQDFPGQSELDSEHHIGGELERDAEAFEVLKAIIRLGGIKPGYSFRKGRTTIYGGKPAVCATEMPLHAFATYARERASAGNVSAYGIAFLKSEFFAAGGRPAIYGLSTENVKYSHKTNTRRIMDETVLPKREQYRYVAHNPKQATRPIDWSHEREWRWVSQDPDLDEVWMKDYDGVLGPVPALPIFKGSLEGRSFTKVCILVWSNEEAESIRKLLTGIYLSGHNNYDTPFDTALIRRARIIVLDDVVNAVEKDRAINAQTIEGLEQAKLLQPITIAAAPPNASTIVAQAFSAAQKAAKTADEKYTANYGEYFSGYGYAHITTTDTTDPIVQYLLSAGQASGPFDGEVRINVPGTTGSRDLDRAEAVNTAIADVLAEKLGIGVYIVTRED